MPSPSVYRERVTHGSAVGPGEDAYGATGSLHGLGKLLPGHAGMEVCSHLYVHRDAEVLLEGHDWYDGLFYVTGKIPEEKIRAFCNTVGCQYERSCDYGPIEE